MNPSRRRNSSPEKRAIARILILLVLAFSPLSCRRPPPILFRYQYRPGTFLDYGVTLQGEGKIMMTNRLSETPEEITFPVKLEGAFDLLMTVLRLSPEGLSHLELSYNNIDFRVLSKVRDQEVKVALDEEGIRTWEGDRLLREIKPEEADFPLQDLSQQHFFMQVDRRGKIEQLEVPASFSTSFPYIDLKGVLEQVQPLFPQRAVRVGESWRQEGEVKLPPLTRRWKRGGSWKWAIDYTFKKVEARGDRQICVLALAGEVVREKEEPAEEAESASRIDSFTQNLRGELRFDPQAGEVLSSQISLEEKLDLVMWFPKIIPDGSIELSLDFSLKFEMELQQKGSATISATPGRRE